jgi:cytochrome P450 family 110
MHLPHVTSPPLQQLWQWSFRPLEYLDDCYHRYGDGFIGQIGQNPILFFSHPDAIADIFSASPYLDAGRAQQSASYSVGDSSSLVMDGEPHSRRRRLLMPPFHGERMRAYGQTMQTVAKTVASTWPTVKPVNMLAAMSEISLQIILKTVFGMGEGDRYDQIKSALQAFVEVAATPMSYLLSNVTTKSNDRFPKSQFWQQRQRIDQLIFAEIADRRTHPDPDRTDILAMLLAARDEAGNALNDQELRDELMTMLLAGHDSSAASLAWALYFIHSNPTIKAKLLAELRDANAAQAEPMTIARLPYLSAVCSESLRLRSAAPVILQRIVNAPIAIQGVNLPVGTLIAPCNYLTHHRPDIYPSPRLFRPERFLERQYSSSEFYPFGGGDRYCIGAAFAMFEMKLVLSEILMAYDLTVAQKTPIRAIRRGINIAPQRGVTMMVQPRILIRTRNSFNSNFS